MGELKIEVGNYDVIYSGTVITLKNSPIVLTFEPEYASLKFIIEFLNDLQKKEPYIKLDKSGDKSLNIWLVNMTGSFGLGNNQLIEVGYHNDKKIFLNFRVYVIKELSNTFHYTFYIEKEGTYGT
jgi:hypothetical protein